MKKCITGVFFTTAMPLFLFGAEPSAFGAGDLNSPEPYGLTSNEKVILETKKKLHTVVVKSNNQANEVDSLRERLDGLQSVIESLSRKAHNNKIKLQKLQDENSLKSQSSDEYERRLSEVVASNTKEIQEVKKVASELTVIVDTINTNYVTKKEFNVLVHEINQLKEVMAKEMKQPKTQKSKQSSKSSAALYNEAKKYFDKKYYTNAIENYEILIKRNYKPAYAHYMIGEMNFRRKNYANALSYFKKSTALYSKAKYMPTLMLHSAIAMERTGDSAHAKKFYQAIVKKYPNSKEAKEAQKHL